MGLVAVIAIVAVTAVVAFKRHASGGLAEGAITTGLSELRSALETQEPAKFDAAETQFTKAASLAVIDFYPAFLIQTTRRLRDQSFDDAPPGQADVLRAISDRDWERAGSHADALGAPGSKPRIFYEELVRALR